MRKILIITTIGGFLQQFEMNDIDLLLDKGCEIHYASNFNNPVYDFDQKMLKDMGIVLHPICIHKSPVQLGENLKALKEICNIIRSENIEAIHCHNPMGGVLARLAALRCGKKKVHVIYTAHGFHFYKGASLVNWLFFFPVEYILAKWTDCLVTINREDYLRAKKFRTLKDKKIFQIPGVGIKISKFADVPESKEAIREELGIPQKAFYLLSVGELNHNKNHEVVMRALAKISDKNICYGICGRGYHDQYLKDLAKELGIEDRVFLFGFRKDIPRMLKAADIFVFPSLREGLGIAAVEAMAAGLPMITSDCRGTREYMEDEITGRICYNGTVEEYKEIIEWMICHEDERKKMSQAVRVRAQKFDIGQAERVMKSVYDTIP
ncbi:MAG: glycosyltransferase family 4 protein [Lachnospiraceae bacterium]|nr:glycosyltransferase family 4 protein [Lachnospiraceae bacterium]